MYINHMVQCTAVHCFVMVLLLVTLFTSCMVQISINGTCVWLDGFAEVYICKIRAVYRAFVTFHEKMHGLWCLLAYHFVATEIRSIIKTFSSYFDDGRHMRTKYKPGMSLFTWEVHRKTFMCVCAIRQDISVRACVKNLYRQLYVTRNYVLCTGFPITLINRAARVTQ